ncbi:hypothetical protein BH10ACI1_BH10ACI1_03970 [soil metagenome]
MRKFLTGHSFILTVPFLFVLVFIAGLTGAKAATLYGVTTANSLIKFDSATPGTVTTVGAITGLQGGENVLGIDFRPATGELYALGSTSRLYVINRMTGAATTVATLSTALSGAEFGMDFNPTVDRIRIVSNTGQNLRVNPVTGAAIVDGVLNPGTPNVTAAAYTNSFSGATTTTLFDIDTNTDQLFMQNPPNAGTLVLVGALGVNATDVNGFDILSSTNTAFAALTVGAATSLYTINMTTGAATSVGTIGAGSASLRGLAAEIGTSASNLNVYGVTTANQLVRFNSARPGTILSTVAITGLTGGENVLGIDFRPATGQLFALGSTSRLYVINLSTGAATAIGSAGAFTLSGTDFGFDFNPTVDRIRVVSNTGQNLRLNPNDGTLAATDGPLNPGTPQITAAAYTNSFAGATTTTLYDIDSGNDTLYTQNPPNAGTLVPVGALGIDITGLNGFDIAAGSGTALAGVQLTGDTTSKLYAINLTTGAASFVGPIGAATPLRGMAIASGSAASTTLDFDGDRKSDYSFFRLSENNWYINRSSNNSFYAFPFGSATDNFTPGDYDGDGITDVSVWRGTNGTFFVFRSSDSTVQAYQFGLNGDEPVARDYDGDGKTDFAVVRRSGGLMTWYVNNSTNNSFRIEQFGLSTDITATGDYDGDGRFDLGVFRDGVFYTQRSRDGFSVVSFGTSGDLVVPGDYDGDGKTDFALVRGGTQFTWLILRSSDNGFSSTQFGAKPDFSTQGDYDGDGKTDISVWRATNGNFYVVRSSNGAVVQRAFGQNGDYPIANFDTH